MSGHASDQPASNGLEEQVRNMLLTGPSSPQPALHPQQSRPTVRLPPAAPSGPYAAMQNQYSHGSNAGPHTQPQPPVQPYPQQQQPPYGRGYGSNRGHYAQHGNPQHPAAGGPQFRQPYQQHNQYQGYPTRGRGRPFQQGQQGPRQFPQQQQHPADPNAFGRGGRPGSGPPPQQRRQLYQPSPQATHVQQQYNQKHYLDGIVAREVPLVEMSQNERDEKDAFRAELEQVCQAVCAANPERLPKVSIQGFGSFESGFASAGSDMDLVLVVESTEKSDALTCFSPMEDDLPRSLEKRLLQMGIGAHLLTRTRVPIIKVCQLPGSTLLSKLRAEREKWDEMDRDKKYPHLKGDEDEHADDDLDNAAKAVLGDEVSTAIVETTTSNLATETSDVTVSAVTESTVPVEAADLTSSTPIVDTGKLGTTTKEGDVAEKPRREPWTRERKAGPLDFPKDGVGIQTDINFFNPLGIHNTQMLRCYSLCDPRVRPMILFVKSWVKRRKINSSYSGTLSSYGYVLMVLHYLVNVAQPAVLPNLQQPWRPNDQCTAQGADRAEVEGWEVDFWRRADEIKESAERGELSANKDSLGSLLAGFFHYYSSQGGQPQFHWMGQVLSLRSMGGVLSKEEKGWVKAVTEQGAGKQVQHRYLFCIEDPFERTHNVARTVTHNGIVAIRDEFRRANRILRAVGNGYSPSQADGELFDELVEEAIPPPPINWNGGRMQPRQPPTGPSRALNVKDTDAFPSLGPKPAKSQGKKAGGVQSGEISGEQAKAYLEGLKRQN